WPAVRSCRASGYSDTWRLLGFSLLPEEHVLRAVGDTQVRSGLVARALRNAALGIDALDGRHARQDAVAAPLCDLELEPRDVRRAPAGRSRDGLADDCAAVVVLPTRPSIVPTRGLAVDEQRRNGLAELPREPAARVGLALVHLRALGMHRD